MTQSDDPYRPTQQPASTPPGQYGPPPGQYPPPPGQFGPPPGQYPPPPGQYGQAPSQYGQPPAFGYGQAPALAVPPGMYIEPTTGLMLPIGVQLAGVGRRIGAYFLSILLFIVTLGIGYIIWGLIAWGRGQSPAIQVLGMRYWNPQSGRPAGWGRMALLEIIGRLVESILGFITGLISFILMVSDNQHRSLHDRIASTVVVYDPNKILATFRP